MKRLMIGALLAATACSTASGSSADYRSVQAIRDKLAAAGVECSNYEQNKGVMGAREDGTCQYRGDDMTITIYDSADQRDKIRKAFATFHSGIDVDGGAWAVNVPTQEEASKVAAALGGTVR